MKHPAKTHAIVKSIDDHVYSVPQDHINHSRFFVALQSLQPTSYIPNTSHPITPMLPQQNLDLFFDACNAHSFDAYYESLSPENRSLLTNVAGEHQLNVPDLTLKILEFHTLKGLPEIIKNIGQHLEVDDMLEYLYKNIVMQRATRRTKKFVFPHETRSFERERLISYNSQQEWSYYPPCIMNNKKSHVPSPQDIFNGHNYAQEPFFQATFKLNKKKKKKTL